MFLSEIGRESQTGHNLVTTPANPLRSAPKMAMGSTRRTCSRVDEVSRWYRFMYKLGLHPWEDDTESQLTQLRSLLKRIEDGCDSPRRTALDLGCGTGRYSIELAKRGWDVVGVDVVPKAVELARQSAHQANVTARFCEGDVTDLEHAGVGDGFRLFLDAECFNHLSDDQRIGFGRGVDAVAGPDAEMLILVWRRARRGPLPPGANREDLAHFFPGWTILDELEYEAALPLPLKRVEPRWYLLARTRAQRTGTGFEGG